MGCQEKTLIHSSETQILFAPLCLQGSQKKRKDDSDYSKHTTF